MSYYDGADYNGWHYKGDYDPNAPYVSLGTRASGRSHIYTFAIEYELTRRTYFFRSVKFDLSWGRRNPVVYIEDCRVANATGDCWQRLGW